MHNNPQQLNMDKRTYNEWTRLFYDTCSYSNALNVGAKPMKYYVNEINSPQANPFQEFTVIGNQKQYNVRNDYERPLPTRLNALYQTYIEPHPTTPFLASINENRQYTNTGTELRFGQNLRPRKSALALNEVDYNRWQPNIEYTVQNAGQYQSGASMQPKISRNGQFDPFAQNNVLFANSSVPRTGISSRNLLHNYQEINSC